MFHIINVKTLNATLSYHGHKIKKAVFQFFVIKTETTSTRMITELLRKPVKTETYDDGAVKINANIAI